MVGRARHATTRRAGRGPAGSRLGVYSHSLGLAMAAIFLASWLVAVASPASSPTTRSSSANCSRRSPGREYLASPDFWNRTLQNWQSELLALVSMAVLAVFLRERGSPGVQTGRRPARRFHRPDRLRRSPGQGQVRQPLAAERLQA